MTRYLLATASVHVTAAACDYLADRLGEGDAVRAVTVEPPDADPEAARDGADALNVARTRLVGTDAETETRAGDPAAEILAAADAFDADEILVGPRGGEPDGGDGLGATAARVAARADRPVVVVPLAPV